MTFEKAIEKVLMEQSTLKELFLIEALKPFFEYDDKTNKATIKDFMRLKLQDIEDYKQKVLDAIDNLMADSEHWDIDDIKIKLKKELGLV